MQGGSIARRYARALFDLAQAQGQAEQAGSELQLVLDTFRERRELLSVWENPEYSVAVKVALVEHALGDRVSALVRNFLGVVARRRREALLADINREYVALVDQALNRVEVEVRTAAPLTDEVQAQLEKKLAATLGKQIKFRTLVDKDLMGGLVVRVDDVLMDGSIRSQLARMQSRLSRATQTGGTAGV